MGHGHRNMYRLTGLPGWMRFGYSPGWGGTPPCVDYLSETGQLPQAVDWFQQGSVAQDIQQPRQTQQNQPVSPQSFGPSFQMGGPAQVPGFSRDQEIQMLENQLGFLEEQVNQIKNRLEQLMK